MNEDRKKEELKIIKSSGPGLSVHCFLAAVTLLLPDLLPMKTMA